MLNFKNIISIFSNKAFDCALVFLFMLTTYVLSPNITSFDSKWSIYTAASIIYEGNTDLDEYKEELVKSDFYAISTIDGHYYGMYPIGVSISAIPFVLIFDKISPYISASLGYLQLELFTASFIVALTGIIMYLISRQYLGQGYSLLIVLVFAFCTSAWSTASRALWQHGLSMLMLSIVLYLAVASKKRPWLIQLTALPLAFSFVTRPTNSLSIIFFTAYVFIYYRRYIYHYLLWASAIAIPFLFFNYSVYHSILSPYYYQTERMAIATNAHFFEALAGTILSPSRGLFIFTPVFLFSILGIYWKIKRHEAEKIDYFIIGIILSHWITLASFADWWGGHSFGPRYFTDIVPFFIYFLIFALNPLANSSGLRGKILTVIFYVLMLISLFIHYRGAAKIETLAWNGAPVDINYRHDRLWDWKDIQFLSGIEYFDKYSGEDLDPLGVESFTEDTKDMNRIKENEVNKYLQMAIGFYNRGIVYYNKGQYEKAIRDYSMAIDLNPNFSPAFYNRGNVYYSKGQYNMAIEDFNKAIALDPNNAKTHSSRGLVYDDKNLYDEAIEDYNKAITLNTNDAKVYYNRGNVYNKIGQYDKAINDFTEAIELDPNIVSAYNNSGLAYESKGEYEEALMDYNKVIELDPNYALAYINRGRSYGQQNQLKKEKADYNKAIEIDPNLSLAYIARGTSYQVKGNINEAISDFQKACYLGHEVGCEYLQKVIEKRSHRDGDD